MEKNYFNALSTDIKTELTWNCGKMVTVVETKDLYLSLFRLDHFFIEIHINKANSELIEIGLQEDRDVLMAYLKNR